MKRGKLINALGNKDPKAIEEAIKDFEDSSESVLPPDDTPLTNAVRFQKHELDKKDCMLNLYVLKEIRIPLIVFR